MCEGCGRILDIGEATQGETLLCRYLSNGTQNRLRYLERHAPSFAAQLQQWTEDMALHYSFYDKFASPFASSGVCGSSVEIVFIRRTAGTCCIVGLL